MKFTIGQIVFLVICLLAAGFLDFYLGARFGPELIWGIRIDQVHRETLLPNEISDAELEALLAEEAGKITFHEVLENKAPDSDNVLPVAVEPPQKLTLESTAPAKKEEEKPEAKIAKEEAKPESVQQAVSKKEEVAKAKSLPEKKAAVAMPPEPPKPDPIAALTQEIEQPKPAVNYALQVGSFSDPDQANGVKNAFAARGYAAFIKEVSLSNKGTWYRVHVGKYSSEPEALQAQEVINKNYKIMPLIVKLSN